MANFAGYMFFSTIEFIALMLLTFSLFTFDVRYYRKELLITSVSVTLLSYVFVIFNISQWLAFVEFILLTLVYTFGFKQKWYYAIWISFAGLAAYILLQLVVAFISIKSGLITATDTSESFGFIPYLHQTITAVIATAIAIYVRANRQGFGFTFRTKLYRLLYSTIAFLSIIICSFAFFMFYTNTHIEIYFYLLVASFTCLFLISMGFSFKKDREEFSFA